MLKGREGKVKVTLLITLLFVAAALHNQVTVFHKNITVLNSWYVL